jgi:hypothetical protein
MRREYHLNFTGSVTAPSDADWTNDAYFASAPDV